MLKLIFASLMIVALVQGLNIEQAQRIKLAAGKKIRVPTSFVEKPTCEIDPYDGQKLDNMREGDIRVVPRHMSLARSFGGNAPIWPGGEIPYEIAKQFRVKIHSVGSQRATILAGMEMLTNKTGGCITFRERTRADTTYIKVVSSNGCWSYLGMAGFRGAQKLSLSTSGCVYKGTVVHEFMHALGFEHEHTRSDRDNHIIVNFENIENTYHNQFYKNTGNAYGTTYDYFSVMHYSGYSASKNGLPVFTLKNTAYTHDDLLSVFDMTDDQILTASDLAGVAARYSC